MIIYFMLEIKGTVDELGFLSIVVDQEDLILKVLMDWMIHMKNFQIQFKRVRWQFPLMSFMQNY